MLTDIQKFKCIITKFNDLYKDYNTFAKNIGVSPNSVNNWERGKVDNIHRNKKVKIAQFFDLDFDIWGEYKTINEFCSYIDTLKYGCESDADRIIFDDKIEISKEEEELLQNLYNKPEASIPANLRLYTPKFIFELTKLLKSKNQIDDALVVLEYLEKGDSHYKYYFHKQIKHLKAILLSHDSIKKFDEAIDILKYLYADCYQKDEPEIVTLIASNYKRKAFYSLDGNLFPKELVNLDFVAKSLNLYNIAYKLKKSSNTKYYDAVNIAYLTIILNKLENTNINFTNEIEQIYKEVYQNWQIDTNNWWEVISKVEMLLLLNQADKAAEIYDIFTGKVEKFEIATTIRQLELYLKYINNTDIKLFKEVLEDRLKTT